MPSAAALIAIIAWANIAVAALWGWGDLLAYLPWVLHRAAGAGAVLAVAVEYLARVFLTVAAGLGSWERRPWARLWLLFASGWTLVVDAALIHTHTLSGWWRSAGNLGIFGWLGGAVPVSRDVVAVGTLVIFSLPDVRREFRAAARWELIAIRVVIACDLMFNGTTLWQHMRDSYLVAHPRPRPERSDGRRSVDGTR